MPPDDSCYLGDDAADSGALNISPLQASLRWNSVTSAPAVCDKILDRGVGDMSSTIGNRFVRNALVLTPGADPNRSQTSSPFRLTMPYITPGQIAFSAMQFLPVPVLVLDGTKTVVLANEAMGRLLGIVSETDQEPNDMVPVIDRLRGQSLSQVGVDILQGGGPVWVNWEQLLDEVAAEVGVGKTKGDSDDGEDDGDGEMTPTQNLEGSQTARRPSNATCRPQSNAVIEVVISRRDIGRTAFDARARSRADALQSHAKMIVSVWEISESQTFFTLTFTSTDTAADSLPSRRKSVARPVLLEAAEKKCPVNYSNPSSLASSHGSASSVILTPSAVTLSSSPFPPLGSPSKSSLSSAPSILQKILLMKDALLDNTQTPILASKHEPGICVLKLSKKDTLTRPKHSVEGWERDVSQPGRAGPV